MSVQTSSFPKARSSPCVTRSAPELGDACSKRAAFGWTLTSRSVFPFLTCGPLKWSNVSLWSLVSGCTCLRTFRLDHLQRLEEIKYSIFSTKKRQKLEEKSGILPYKRPQKVISLWDHSFLLLVINNLTTPQRVASLFLNGVSSLGLHVAKLSLRCCSNNGDMWLRHDLSGSQEAHCRKHSGT